MCLIQKELCAGSRSRGCPYGPVPLFKLRPRDLYLIGTSVQLRTEPQCPTFKMRSFSGSTPSPGPEKTRIELGPGGREMRSVWYRLTKKITPLVLIAFWCPAAAVGQAATVDIYPGTDIPSVVNAYPAATTFVIQPGIYRLRTPIGTKDGATFIGQTACAPPQTPCPAILNGSELLTSFQRLGSYYYVTGQTQHNRVSVTTMWCQTGYPGCIYPEDLYFDDVPLTHVTTLADVGPGTWFFDYPNATIYFYDNPAGHKVETSVAPSAFDWGPANNVTIKGLTVEKFATPILTGVVAGSGGVGSPTSGADCSNPFNFSWNTSGVSAGPHTVAAMAYNTEGIRACYAVTLRVP